MRSPASNLLKVGLDGHLIGESQYQISPTAIVIHGAIHAAREDAKCLLHSHTTAAGLLPPTKTNCSQ